MIRSPLSGESAPQEPLPASRVKSSAVPFLWRRRIPLGTLSLIAGRPGIGKSQVAVLIAAELSLQGLVTLLSNPEDDREWVTKPRIEGQSCNPGLIYLADPDQTLVFPRDLRVLEERIRELQASLVILDPMSAHFRSDYGVHNRSNLRQLIAVARRTRCAILGIHHTVKTASDLISQVGGSMGGLVGSSRAVYLLRSPRADGTSVGRVTLDCIKINAIEAPAQMRFDVLTKEIAAGLETAKLELTSIGFGLMPNELSDMSEWLSIYLAAGEDGVRLHGEIRSESQQAGFSWAKLQQLGVDLKFLSFNGGPRWRLPDDHPLRTGEER